VWEGGEGRGGGGGGGIEKGGGGGEKKEEKGEKEVRGVIWKEGGGGGSEMGKISSMVEDSVREWGEQENVVIERVVVTFRPVDENYDDVWGEEGRVEVKELDPDILQVVKMRQMGVGGGVVKEQGGGVLIETWKTETVGRGDVYEEGVLVVRYKEGFRAGFVDESFRDKRDGNSVDRNNPNENGGRGIAEVKAKLRALATFMPERVRAANRIDGDNNARRILGAFRDSNLGNEEEVSLDKEQSDELRTTKMVKKGCAACIFVQDAAPPF